MLYNCAKVKFGFAGVVYTGTNPYLHPGVIPFWVHSFTLKLRALVGIILEKQVVAYICITLQTKKSAYNLPQLKCATVIVLPCIFYFDLKKETPNTKIRELFSVLHLIGFTQLMACYTSTKISQISQKAFAILLMTAHPGQLGYIIDYKDWTHSVMTERFTRKSFHTCLKMERRFLIAAIIILALLCEHASYWRQLGKISL